jgi:DNA-binding response OmpR family regulator/two-component sensor histidine kinase
MYLTRLLLLGLIALLFALFLFGRWLYLRSMRIRNQLQMSYIFTNITHELLTPLSIISASVEKLRETQPTNLREYDLMELNIQRSVRLLQQILETSKSQAGELKLLVSNADVMQHIKETAQSIVPLMDRKHINFSINCKPESMMGWIDTDKLDKIIFNLLSNAAKYTDEGGVVILNVSTNRRFDRIQIRVSDNGPGIPKERQKNLFSRFYDGDYRRNKTRGTGLGLALTRDLVNLNRGTIHFESIVGQGTTFIVELPIKKDYFNQSQIDESQQTQFHIPAYNISDLNAITAPIYIEDETTATTDEDAYNILIVEDNQDLLMLMKQLLQPKYHIFTATNGWEAMKVVENEPMDLIVSDVMMPVMDGYELTKRLKQDSNYSHLPIILLTAKIQEEDRMEALSIGADSMLTKPFKMKELQLRIDNIIANRQRIRSDKRQEGEESTEATGDPKLSMDQEYLQRAIACINEHISDSDYDREAFASDMGSSVSTLYNKIRLLTGKSVTNFVRDIRIQTACKLALDDPDLRVSDIAYRVGFKDPKYFATSFKRVMGEQPKEHFDKIRKEKQQ